MTQFYLIYILIPLLAGALLDFLFGDPLNRFHPVVLIGRLISCTEQRLYKKDDTDDHPDRGRRGAAPGGEEPPCGPRRAANRKAGIRTVLLVCGASVLIPTILLAGLSCLAGLIAPAAGRIVCSAASALLCWQMLAGRSLELESMKVYDALWPFPPRNAEEGTEAAAGFASGGSLPPAEARFPSGCVSEDRLQKARRAVSMIVGRDTESLDEQGIIRAAVETVAENTGDGVIAPVLFMALLGIPGIMLYKAVNTMDSMIGYKNEKYLDFGRAAARTDDVLNYIPARVSGLALILAAFLHRECDGRNAWEIFRRDRRKSSSPNAGCGEAAVAGALHVQLLGPASYFGVRQEKPYIGTDDRPVEREDIRIAGELMYMASGIVLLAIAVLCLFCGALAM